MQFRRIFLASGRRAVAALDWFVPERLRREGEASISLARTVAGVGLSAVFWGGALVVRDIQAGDLLPLALALILTLGLASAPWLMRATGSLAVVRLVLLGAVYVAVTGSALRYGGWLSPVFIVLAFLPAVAVAMQGPRLAIALLGVSSAIAAWTFAAHGLGWRDFGVPRAETHFFLAALVWFVLAWFWFLVIWAFRRHNDLAVGELERSNAELIVARDQASAASHAKSAFLANMSHEIRTPLNGVLGMAQLLLETNPTAKQRELSETIRSCGETLLTLLNEILDLSRIEAGCVEITQVDFDLVELLSDVERIVARSTREKGLALAFSVAPELPEALRGDPDRLRQVLLNLVSNAVKFTDRGGVEVRVESRGNPGPDGIQIVYFDVADTGIGIPPEDVERIFDRFAQLDQSSTRRYGGTGLGLTIAKQLVEMMDGEIGVESRPGQGSRFWFSLPLQTGDPTHPRTQDFTGKARPEKPTTPHPCAPEERTSERTERPPAGARVLLIEDNPVNQSVAVGMLEALGYCADVADDGREGLLAARRTTYDVILMDCQMPVMDGFEITREIRRLERSRPEPDDSTHEPVHVPIIALTAAAFPGDRERCLAAGMDDYLAKPFELKELAEVLARCLSGAGSEPTDASEPAPALPPRSRQTVLERERLAEIRALEPEGGGGLLERVVGAYFDSTPGLIEAMADAIDKGDGGALANAAHSLKSSSASLGALRLSELCKELEALGRAGSTTGASTLLTELRSEFARVQRALADEA